MKNVLYLVLERKSASKSIVYTDSDPIPMFSKSCTQDRISPLQEQEQNKRNKVDGPDQTGHESESEGRRIHKRA